MKTILESMCAVSKKMRNPDDSDEIIINKENLAKATRDLSFLRKTLDMTTMEVLILTGIIQKSSRYRINADDVSAFLGMEYLEFLTHYEELRSLRKKGYIRIDKDGDIAVPPYTLVCLKENKPVEPLPTKGLTGEQILKRIKKFLEVRDRNEMTTEEFYEEVSTVLNDNPESSITLACQKYHVPVRPAAEYLTFFGLVYRYWFEDDDMVGWHDLDDYLDEDELDEVRNACRRETMALQRRGIIEFTGEDMLIDRDYFHIKDEIKAEIFADVGGLKNLKKNKTNEIGASRKVTADEIERKELFYNPAEKSRIERLRGLLSEKSFNDIRGRMKEKGLRSGFTCLFYGAPGTGKTETVYQLARESGRDLFIVDVSQIKSCWVGESEKNIKNLFDKYRRCVKKNEKTPILLFNEADAIFGIRQQGAERAVDKMENSIQNIILQEMEDLDGILIATTNLTENLDKAFERRFLFKVRFEKPTQEVKLRIWKSMMPDLPEANAAYLADHYDFSGGQIENVARKKTIEDILSGEQPTLEQLIEYCRDEVIEASKAGGRIGF